MADAYSVPDVWGEIIRHIPREMLPSIALVDKQRLGVVRSVRFGSVILTKAKTVRELLKAINSYALSLVFSDI
jgi:hypothetical protein